jgi:hypothetical protein
MLTSDTPQAEITETVDRVFNDEDQEGIRISRAGGDTCKKDSDRLMTFTLDVYCNPDVTREPKNMQLLSTGEPDDQDECEMYVSMEHASGCPAMDLVPFLRVLGAGMIFVGVIIQYFGQRAQKVFLKTLVTICTFVLVLAICYKLGWLASLDPTVPKEDDSIGLCIAAFILAIVATVIMRWAFRKFIRLAPTAIGCFAGYWLSIWLIVAINGIGGAFVSVPGTGGSSADVIGPYAGAGIELGISAFGGFVGYTFSFVFILIIRTFVSAYLIVRGTTLWINLGFPNEVQLMESATSETNGLVKLPPAFYVYSFCILAIWLISFKTELDRANEQGYIMKDDEDSDD